MSDKSYTPASGKSYQVKRAAGISFEVQKEGDKKAAQISLKTECSQIDASTQRILLDKNGARKMFWVFAQKGKRVLSWPGGSIELDAAEFSEGGASSGSASKPLKLTMPGKVLAVKVKEGDLVDSGQGLVVVEAMKMENLLLAPGRAKIAKIHVKEGDRLESGATLITFSAAE